MTFAPNVLFDELYDWSRTHGEAAERAEINHVSANQIQNQV